MEAGFYAIKRVGGPIGTGVSGAVECEMLGIGKDDALEPYTLANEYMCSQLAGAVGLPAPPGTIAQTNTGEKLFVCLRFDVGGTSLPSVDPDELVADRPSTAAGIVVFDCWVGNWDRHAANVAYVRGASGVSMFDHGRTLLRGHSGSGEAWVTANRDEPLIHAPQNVLCGALLSDSDLVSWSERIGRVADEHLQEIAATASRLGLCSTAEAAAVSDFLIHRKSRLMTYIDGQRILFPRIGTWGQRP